MAPTYNKYDHMDPPINVLTLFEYQNEEALQQVAFDFLMTNGAIVVHNDGTVWASGVTVLHREHGSLNGDEWYNAASAAAMGDNDD